MSIINVDDTNTQLLEAGERDEIFLSNRGDETAWVSFDVNAAENEGFPLDAGDKVVLTKHQTNTINRRLRAICGNGLNTDVSVYEVKK